MCEKSGHTGIECPWVYTRCRKITCNGSRKLLISKQPHSLGNRFLKCENCDAFQWFDDAIGLVGPSSIQPNEGGCFGCGDLKHWIKECPWRETSCSVPTCKGKRLLSLSGTTHNYGIPYLKCSDCQKFQWMADVLFASRTKELEVVDGLCKAIVNKMQFK
ncbi:hypothetical protein BVC80_1787g184 [Macleaya cordata]|uniref:Zinc finger protein n=1 Tax=Macleaya cordata TaxID=56857 RepID=A0A200QUE4_MACCD|nr:hypothetical protein BVC80_8469g13 [Macleaya cordata]OVA14096.1 hypothetical protein BVC80_1787g184 [Macleaya cordata]